MTGFRTARNSPVSLPYSGINTREPLPNLTNNFAAWIENFFVDGQTLSVRNGSKVHSTLSAATSNIFSVGLSNYSDAYLFGVMKYNSGPAVKSIVNFTFPVGSVAATSNVDATQGVKPVRFRNYLYYFSAQANPTYFDGTTWASGAPFTGPTFGGIIGSIFTGSPYRNRLYLVEFFGTSVWYGGVNSVSGAMTELDLSSLLNFGGYVIGAYPISFSDNTQAQNAIAFLSDQGEILFYQGAYPESPDWTLISRAKISKPLSYFYPEIQFQGDTLLITDTGLVSLRDILTQGSNAGLYAAISQNIDILWNKLALGARELNLYNFVNGTFFSTNGCIYVAFPLKLQRNGSQFYFDEDTAQDGITLLVFNTLTGAWFAEIFNTDGQFISSMVEFQNQLIVSYYEKNFATEIEKANVYRDVNINDTSSNVPIVGSIVSAAFTNPTFGSVVKNNALSLYSYVGASVTSAIQCALVENFGQRNTPTTKPQIIINGFNETKMSIGSVAPYLQYILSAETNSENGNPTTLYAINVLNESGGFG